MLASGRLAERPIGPCLPHVFPEQLAVDANAAIDAGGRDEVDGAVDTLEQGGFARVRRSDNAEDGVLADMEVEAVDQVLIIMNY